jgi:hypothetical protein
LDGDSIIIHGKAKIKKKVAEDRANRAEWKDASALRFTLALRPGKTHPLGDCFGRSLVRASSGKRA